MVGILDFLANKVFFCREVYYLMGNQYYFYIFLFLS